MSSRAGRRRRGPPEFHTYTLTAKGEVLGTVDVRPGTRLGPDFCGYFHPVRAFSRVWPLFEAYERAYDRYYRLYAGDYRASPSPALRRGQRLDVSEALARAKVAQEIAHQELVDLGLELSDSRGRRLETGSIYIERTRLEEQIEFYERYTELYETSPYDEIDDGVDVSPYRLSAHEPEKDPAESPSRKEPWGEPWTPAKEREEAARWAAEDAVIDAWLDGQSAEDDEDAGDGEVPWEDDYEWYGDHPSFEDKMVLLQRAAVGHPRDTFRWVLDLAKPRDYDDDKDRDEWVKAVQRARSDGLLDEELSQFLIWKIVTDAHEYRHKVADPVMLELHHRMNVLVEKYGMEPDDLDQMTDPPAEWSDLDKAWNEREPRIVGDVLISAGETALEAAMRERPEEFAARMAVWEEKVGREERVRRRAQPEGESGS
jgi:hypothetical protein